MKKERGINPKQNNHVEKSAEAPECLGEEKNLEQLAADILEMCDPLLGEELLKKGTRNFIFYKMECLEEVINREKQSEKKCREIIENIYDLFSFVIKSLITLIDDSENGHDFVFVEDPALYNNSKPKINDLLKELSGKLKNSNELSEELELLVENKLEPLSKLSEALEAMHSLAAMVEEAEITIQNIVLINEELSLNQDCQTLEELVGEAYNLLNESQIIGQNLADFEEAKTKLWTTRTQTLFELKKEIKMSEPPTDDLKRTVQKIISRYPQKDCNYGGNGFMVLGDYFPSKILRYMIS